MSASCEEVRALLAELALGIADGEARASGLAHVAQCADCRRELETLTKLGDELLLLAPEREPSAGFESRVLARIEAERGGSPARPSARKRRRWLPRVLIPVASAALAATAAAVIALDVTSEDRQAGARYRATLDEAGGRYFSAARLRSPGGQQVGVAFGYQGKPSWVFVVVRGTAGYQRYDAEVVTTDGRRVTVPGAHLSHGSWGRAIPLDMRDVAGLRLVGVHRGEVLNAQFK